MEAINNLAPTVFVSAVSGRDLATKVRLGQRPSAEGLLQDLPSIDHQQDFRPLALRLRHRVHAGRDIKSHRNHFDGLLTARAELEGLQLVNIVPSLATF